MTLVSRSFFIFLRYSYYFLQSCLFDGIHYQYSQVLVIFFSFQAFWWFLLWLFSSSYWFSFLTFHYEHGTVFSTKFYSYILTVYSFWLYQGFQFFLIFCKYLYAIYIHNETRLTKAWTAINRLSIIWKSDLTDKMKRSFFLAVVTSILLYGCTTWTLTKRLEKKLDGNYTRMLRAILNKSWQQHPTRHQLYGYLPPITKTIQVRRTRHAGHCWRSRDELIRDVLLWILTHGRAKAGRPAWTYIQQLCEDTGCCPEDLPRAMNDREEWRERVRDIRATSAIWWWWWYTQGD